MTTKMSINGATNMRVKQCFDYLLLNRDRLTNSQLKSVLILKAESKVNCLTDLKIKSLLDLQKSLTPNKTLLIHNC
jgi:hypothetical protein